MMVTRAPYPSKCGVRDQQGSTDFEPTIETKQANGESRASRSFFLLKVVAKKGVNSDFLTWVELVSTAHNTYARFT